MKRFRGGLRRGRGGGPKKISRERSDGSQELLKRALGVCQKKGRQRVQERSQDRVQRMVTGNGVAEAGRGRMQAGVLKICGQKLTIVWWFCLDRMHFEWSISDHDFFEPT